mgnify:FL=1
MSIRSQVMKAIDANPGLPHHMLARKVAADIGEEALIKLATERIERIIVTERRKRIRDLENDSTDDEGRGDPAKWAAVDALLEEFRSQVIVDWTADLLAAEFAVGDGTNVTWGRATTAQHLARISLLTKNARGNLSAIRRHEAALHAVTERGVTCLDEAVTP